MANDLFMTSFTGDLDFCSEKIDWSLMRGKVWGDLMNLTCIFQIAAHIKALEQNNKLMVVKSIYVSHRNAKFVKITRRHTRKGRF